MEPGWTFTNKEEWNSYRPSLKDAIKEVATQKPELALALIEPYIEAHLDHYQGQELFKLGRLIEKARYRHLNLLDVLSFVGPTNYDRGLEYVSWDRVKSFTVGEDIVSASVIGTYEYETWAAFEGNSIVASSCSCPVHSNICKHVAAVLITYVNTSNWVDEILALL